MPTTYHQSHLRTLDAEAVQVMREVAAEEVWSLYNGRIRKGEHARVVPISNWTELDVWQDIAEEEPEVPSIYFAHARHLFTRDGMPYPVSPSLKRQGYF